MSQRASRLRAWRFRVNDRYCPGVFAALGVSLAASLVLLITGVLPSVLAGERPPAERVSAAQILKEARANREVFSEDFEGFRSGLAVRLDGKALAGTLEFRLPDKLDIELSGGPAPDTVTRTVRSMLMHRVPTTGNAVGTAAFGEPDEHSLGTEIVVGDSYRSVYRIRDRQILQVDRRLSDFRRLLTVLETETTDSGRYLPRHVFAVLFDSDSGAIREAWTYMNGFQKVGGNYLPLFRHVMRTVDGETSALLIEWHDIELLDPSGSR